MIITEIDDEYPQFAQIKDIFIADNKISFEANIFIFVDIFMHMKLERLHSKNFFTLII